MNTHKRALVLGASGGIGGELAVRLVRRGWEVHALQHRSRMAGHRGNGIYWWRGDAMNRDDVLQAAKGAALIVHAVSPSVYQDGDTQSLPMLQHTLDAAVAGRARVLLPAAACNYGPTAGAGEDAPQRPLTRRGALRADMERRLRDAVAQGARALVVRSGDHFGPHAGHSWFSQAMVEPGRAVSGVRYPGRAGIGHQWCYLPDLAETMLRLIESEERLGAYESFHVGGHWDADGRAMTAAIARAIGNPDLRVKRFPWSLLRMSTPLLPMLRDIAEQRRLWMEPVRLDNRRLLDFLGEEPRTALDVAVRDTLYAMGCLQSEPMPLAPTRVAAPEVMPSELALLERVWLDRVLEGVQARSARDAERVLPIAA
ncbi:NAD-dependent epimerase/dehydratase family protein [Lysobacter sp. 5GHs7-4]|uniref:NAD-dependent epimerase/dehydratase family protein n=1 Tax=Lysobacter sp. 5GHs7-4 TaxID=2904253 RepID=UPI001E58D5DF|nr:NAD-dependent epimerase/dehydratase family protein [Lysobacter sp. 5GHs7-4]UHQ23005.1 NAD-dependent epimerase/dehydratase family protein [Lysobacter sp. 5GHs7-4]